MVGKNWACGILGDPLIASAVGSKPMVSHDGGLGIIGGVSKPTTISARGKNVSRLMLK